jgi:predicted RNA-binding Zn-ribbon protein involved in translation (DUF1610 family)
LKTCGTCGRKVSDYAEFACPNPADEKGKIVRCRFCRENENQYKCAECGFTGP